MSQNLGSITVIVKPCIFCGKKTEVDSDIQLYVCSVECWLRFKELSKEIDASYGWD